MLCLLGFPGGSDSTEPTCNAGDLGLLPRSGRVSGARQPTPVFLPGDPVTEEAGGLQSTGSQRVRRD